MSLKYIVKPEMEMKEFSNFKRYDFIDIETILPLEIAKEFELEKFAAH